MSLENSLVSIIDVRGVERASAAVDESENADIDSARRKLGGLGRELFDDIPLVVDKRLEGELDTSTMLVSWLDPLATGLVPEGRVRGEFRHDRECAFRHCPASVVERQ